MDVKINVFAILWKRIWGGKKAVFEYLLDKGNTIFAQLPNSSKEKLRKCYAAAATVFGYIDALAWLVPEKWMPYYKAILSCYKALLDALADAQITSGEVDKLLLEFQSAYAVWKSDDVEDCEDCEKSA